MWHLIQLSIGKYKKKKLFFFNFLKEDHVRNRKRVGVTANRSLDLQSFRWCHGSKIVWEQKLRF